MVGSNNFKIVVMKRIFTIIVSIITVFSFNCCNEEDPIGSNITLLAKIELIGERYTIIKQGEVFLDLGAIATENGNEIQFVIDGNVDTNTIGVYNVAYIATNIDGFEATTERSVLVVQNPEEVQAIDLSGIYFDNFDPRFDIEVTSLGNGFFQFTDILVPDNLPAVVAVLDSSTLILPQQESIFGSLLADPSINPETFGFFDDSLINLGYTIGADPFVLDVFFERR